MKNIKMKVQFDGSRYLGWQRLGDSDNTIQGKLEDILCKMTAQIINVIGSSRTDRGVHSMGLVCNFHIDTLMNIREIEEYINRFLPDDIIAYDLEEVDEKFHARYNAKYKVYRYTIDNRKYQNVFTRKFTTHISDSLNLNLMSQASSYLTGTFDFSAFTTMKSKKKSSIRTISSIDIVKKDDYIYIEFRGDGFLHNMIRIISGTLTRVGLGEITPSDVSEILQSKTRSLSGPMLEGKGLCLIDVIY